jgi:hypothetical protein
VSVITLPRWLSKPPTKRPKVTPLDVAVYFALCLRLHKNDLVKLRNLTSRLALLVPLNQRDKFIEMSLLPDDAMLITVLVHINKVCRLSNPDDLSLFAMGEPSGKDKYP